MRSTFKIFIFFCISLLVFSCKTDPKTNTEEAPVVDPLTQQKAALENPCNFMDEAFVSSVVDIPAQDVSIKSGGDGSTVPAKSCFFKWQGGEVANAGLMVQVLGNPIPDEFPNWAFFFIDNKKARGEMTMEEPDVPHKFTTIDIAEQACYNHKLGKCYFRKGDKVYLIAVNGISDDGRKIEVYRKVSDKILSMI